MPAPLHGQVAVSGTAQKLDSSGVAPVAFTIKAPASNSATAYIGASSVTTSNGFPLEPGDDIGYETLSQIGQPLYQMRPSDFYVVGTSGDVVGWIGSPAS